MSLVDLPNRLPRSVLLSLAAVGTCSLVYSTYHLASTVWNFVRPSSLPRYLHCKEGSWALVTGASDGIGRGFVDELLNRGFNVILHGRNQTKLDGIVKQLSASHPDRRLEILTADATDTKQDFGAIRRKVESLPGKLTVLVNNVGGIHQTRTYQRLEGNTSSDIVDCINTNLTFTTCITAALLPLLEANGPSLILNCGSIAPTVCPPYISTYVGTKGYIHAWAASLRAELKAENAPVEVLTVAIGNTKSQGNTYDEPGMTLTAAACAKASLNMVGSGYDVIVPHPTYLAGMLPFYILPQDFIKKQMLPVMKKRYDAEEAEERQKKAKTV